ncbi:MAG TPA: protein meaA [Nitriliruptoraceae bacterium]|nr:protein meaA [Nitriliruptoraceae bacterium]
MPSPSTSPNHDADAATDTATPTPEAAVPSPATLAQRDRPWLIRTYSGHSSAAASNELYRTNLDKGQTGLSVAFDLPTQTGYDSDHPLARGEVGKVGVPVTSIDDMRTLFEDIPLEAMNTSMTINATAMWLLALYIAVAEEQGVDTTSLRGTTQNDILKEYLSRGTYAFPPEPSLRLTTDVVVHTVAHLPKWNPLNICSYHLQEAGATPVQELAFALANAIAVLDGVRDSGQVPEADFPGVVGRISFFVNAGIRFVEEVAKMRAFVELWDRITRDRYDVTDPRSRRFRYGVQVNSLGLTEQQPENNIARILIEMLGVTLSRDARARAVQLPAWNEALGLPRPWDQQVSLRMQQVLAHETDLLDYPDLFTGSEVMEAKVDELVELADAELARILDMGGAVAAVDWMKAELVASNAARLRRIESGEQVVVGVNAHTTATPSPLVADGGILTVDPSAEAEQIARLQAHRDQRDDDAVAAALAELRRAAASGENLMPASIVAARAGVTTGEWSQALRDTFGEYRGPTGVTEGAMTSTPGASLTSARQRVAAVAQRLGRRVRILVGKPGLDGHSNGAEQVALRARDLGMEVIYEGIRLTPDQIVAAAVDEDVALVGLSILSGSHLELVPAVVDGLRAAGHDAPVIAGGIIPPADAQRLRDAGVAAVFTPKDFDLNDMLASVAELAVGSSDAVHA